MICQLCLTEASTQHVTERLPSGRLEAGHYCQACYEAKYVRPPAGGDGFPRARFTLKGLMILVAVFAVPNGLVAWFMRSGHVSGTPAQLRLWTRYAFLTVNGCFGLFVAFDLSSRWLRKVAWYRRTGGLIQRPRPKRLTGSQRRALFVFLVPFLAWMIAAATLTAWLSPRVWPGRRFNPFLLTSLWFAPLLILAILRRLATGSFVADHARRDWTAASRPERLCRLLLLLWGLLLPPILLDSRRLLHVISANPWPGLPVFLLVMLGIPALLFAGIAFSTRRR